MKNKKASFFTDVTVESSIVDIISNHISYDAEAGSHNGPSTESLVFCVP
jgi:hypothetical protein